jgi:hypothetical protein
LPLLPIYQQILLETNTIAIIIARRRKTMKIIGFSGSPRKEGNTAWVVDKILEGAKEEMTEKERQSNSFNSTLSNDKKDERLSPLQPNYAGLFAKGKV